MEWYRAAPVPANLQERFYGEGFDYESGSPHLRHAALRRRIVQRIEAAVVETFARHGRCRVLEVGAGHGSFTAVLAALGAHVTVSEMSGPSVRRLEKRFHHNSNVEVVFDPTGDGIVTGGLTVDMAVCVSVLHHIPDYLGFLSSAAGIVAPGGIVVTYQDPLWYPRRRRRDMAIDRGCYYLWRLRQGDLRRGVGTRLRRLRGLYDESRPEDMTEYHAVRDGVDELAVVGLLGSVFRDVTLHRYWSTNGPLLQRLGGAVAAPNTFGVEARDRR
jgi:SAM-dependent methyltransferase